MNAELNINEIKKQLEKTYNTNVGKIELTKINRKIDHITFSSQGGQTRTIWLKTIAANKIDMTFNTLVKLYGIFANYDDVGIVKPLFFFSDRICLENIPYESSLHKLLFVQLFPPMALFVNKNAMEYYIPKCAKWLALFQNSTMSGEQLYLKDFSFFKPELFEIDLFRLSMIGLPQKYDRILKKYFYLSLDSFSAARLEKVAYHGDVHFGNFLVAKDKKLFGTDFENFDFRSRYDDIALFNVYSALRSVKSVFADKNALKQMDRLFLDEYQKCAGIKIDSQILDFFEMRYLIHVAGNELILGEKLNFLTRNIYFRNLINLLKRRISENEYIKGFNAA